MMDATSNLAMIFPGIVYIKHDIKILKIFLSISHLNTFTYNYWKIKINKLLVLTTRKEVYFR